MQLYFYWINEFVEWCCDFDGLMVVINKYIDFWCYIWYGFECFFGYFYVVEVVGDFILQVKICVDFIMFYDQVGLMMMVDEQIWLKVGIEFNDDVLVIGSVLMLIYFDWVIGFFFGDLCIFWLWLICKGDVLRLQYLIDGECWLLLWFGYFLSGLVKVGVMCCLLECGGLVVVFQDIQFFLLLDKVLYDLS